MSEVFDPNEWITSKEAEDLTGYTRRAFINATKRGTLSYIKRGNMLFYKRDDVLQYVQRMRDLGNKKHTPKIYRETQSTQKTA